MPPKPGGTLRAGLRAPWSRRRGFRQTAGGSRGSHARLTACSRAFRGLTRCGLRPARRRAAGLARDYTPRPARTPFHAPTTLRAPRNPSLSRTLSPPQLLTVSPACPQPRAPTLGEGDTPPRGELPRPHTGAAISPTPPDTRPAAYTRAPRSRRVHAHAIPASPLPVHALRPRARPARGPRRATSRQHRRGSSGRSPAGVPQRQGRSPARRPAASQAPCGPLRSTPLFTIPSAARAGDPADRCAAQRAGLGRRPARRRAAGLARVYTPRPARPPFHAPPTLRAPRKPSLSRTLSPPHVLC